MIDAAGHWSSKKAFLYVHLFNGKIANEFFLRFFRSQKKLLAWWRSPFLTLYTLYIITIPSGAELDYVSSVYRFFLSILLAQVHVVL